MRVLACFIVVLFFSGYAYKRWFISLCASIALMAVLEHPDMPKSIGGIQGLNPWNFLMANVMLAWWIDKNRERRRLDWPAGIWIRIILFVILIFVSSFRLLADPGVLGREESVASMVSEYIVNCVKWLLPGMLIFDGCRDRRNVHLAITSILLVYFLLAVQTIRWVPFANVASGDELAAKAAKLIENEVGYNRVTLSMMLAGAGWGTVATLVLVQRNLARFGVLFVAASIMFGQALTGGRTGYACWLMVGIALCVIRWRKLLLLIPVAVTLVFTFVPAVRERLLFGLVGTDEGVVNQYDMTSGRNIAWPYVIEGIQESPLLGHGRQAMVTEGIRDMLMIEYNESFPHPHNAYLEMFLDNGIIGLVIAISLFFSILWHSRNLLLDKEEPLSTAVGGICFSLVLALLLGSFGGQTFYPREGAVGLWASIGLMFRITVQRKQHIETGAPFFPEDEIAPGEPDASDEDALQPAMRGY